MTSRSYPLFTFMRQALSLFAMASLLHTGIVRAETVQSVTQASYDSQGRALCTTTRMNSAVFGALPADACALGTEGSQGPDRVSKTIYDAASHVLQIRKAVGTPLEEAYATYRYTPDGQMSDVLDAGGNHTQYTYDGFDRQIRWIFPSTTKPAAFNPTASLSLDPSTTTTYSCTPNFTLSGTSCTGISQIVNAGANNSCPSGYVFHAGNGQYYPAYCTLTVTVAANVTYSCSPGYYPDGKCGRSTALVTAGSPNAADYEEYGYDVNSNRTSLRKRDGSVITYAYDALNRVSVKTVPERAGLGSTHTRDVFYGYDLRGLMVAAKFDNAAGEGVTTGYDGLARIVSSSIAMDGTTRTFSYLYDANSNRNRVTYPDANYVTYSYDGLDRPTSIMRSGSGSIASYTYNSIGQRTGFNGAVATSYGYDPVGRLNSLTNNLSATTYNNQWTFGYNPASQIVQTARSNDAFAWTAHVNLDRNYVTNGLNQYTAAGTAAFCYDANGNLTADGSSVYLYDIENRLVEKRAQGAGNSNCAALAYTGTLQAGLRYDPVGRLYEVTGASGTTRLLYDGGALTAEYDTSGNLLRRYVHGADMKADDPIAWYEGSAFASANERQLRSDWEGSIVLVTDQSGSTVLAVNRYDEYGIPQNTNAGRFQYTGQAWLAELGMYYYKARIYSPTLGRFLQTDPIGYDDNLNLYSYVGGDPVNNIDFTGASCDASQSRTKCDPTDSRFPNVTFPTDKSGVDTYNNNDTNFHSYTYSDAVGSGDIAYGKALEDALIENPTPGKGAATRGGNLIDANIPGPWGADHVKSYVIHTAGGHVMVLNVTTKDHTLKYGFVLRMVVNDGHGNYSILTYGEGNNWKQKDGGFFAWLGSAKKNEGTTWTESANKIEQEATRHRR